MDDVIRSKIHYQPHTGELTHLRTQPTEGLILERNNELRKNPGVIHDLGARSEGGSYGRQVASIPFIMYEEAIRDGFELDCGDAELRKSEMMRYLRSEKGKLCLIQGNV